MTLKVHVVGLQAHFFKVLWTTWDNFILWFKWQKRIYV